VAGAVIAVGLATGVSGCGSTPAAAPPGGRATPSAGSTGSGGAAVTGRLPATFPQSAVPVVSGRVQVGMTGSNPRTAGQKGWVVELRSSVGGSACYAAARAKLEGAGYRKVSEFTYGGTASAQFRSSTYQVNVATSESGDGTCIVTYVVVPTRLGG